MSTSKLGQAATKPPIHPSQALERQLPVGRVRESDRSSRVIWQGDSELWFVGLNGRWRPKLSASGMNRSAVVGQGIGPNDRLVLEATGSRRNGVRGPAAIWHSVFNDSSTRIEGQILVSLAPLSASCSTFDERQGKFLQT